MKITYIYHSGFLAETADNYYLFDYYEGSLPPLAKTKPIFVFASHAHQDHYNPKIFDLLKKLGMTQITGILSKDIPAKKYPWDIPIVTVTFHKHYTLPYGTEIDTLHSTDAGVAFLVKCPEGILYHAGDLNDWVWEGESLQYNRQMTGSYRHEILVLADLLTHLSQSIDIAMLPLDPRQEKDYANGLLYFLEKIAVKKVYPMHYWEKPEIIGKFLEEYPKYKNVMQEMPPN